MFAQLIIIISIIFNFLNSIDANINCNISLNEYNSLKAFYLSTNGQYWSNSDNLWIFSNNDLNKPCNDGWYGLTCIVIKTGICAISEINLAFTRLYFK